MTRTTEYLEQKGISFEVLPHDEAFTPADEANALGIDPHLVVKTVVLETKWGRRLVVVPGDCRIDMRSARDVVGDRHVRLASEEEILLAFPEFELGCVPPLGALLDLPVFVDGDIMRHEHVVFAAGSQKVAVRARTHDVFAGERVTVTRIRCEPAA